MGSGTRKVGMARATEMLITIRLNKIWKGETTEKGWKDWGPGHMTGGDALTEVSKSVVDAGHWGPGCDRQAGKPWTVLQAEQRSRKMETRSPCIQDLNVGSHLWASTFSRVVKAEAGGQVARVDEWMVRERRQLAGRQNPQEVVGKRKEIPRDN